MTPAGAEALSHTKEQRI